MLVGVAILAWMLGARQPQARVENGEPAPSVRLIEARPLTLLAETSLQAQIPIPLAISIAFGLSSATLIALFLVPKIYRVLDDFGLIGQLHGEDNGALDARAAG